MLHAVTYQEVTSDGIVVGDLRDDPTTPLPITVFGWCFSNAGEAIESVEFYVPIEIPNATRPPLVASADGTLLFTVDIDAGESKEFFAPVGIRFKYGAFAIGGDDVTGVVLYQ